MKPSSTGPAAESAFEALKDAIAGAYPQLAPQLKRIARYALAHPEQMAIGTVATIAAAAETHPSAIIRFANALGYDGFSSMQRVFQGNLIERSKTYRERIDGLRRSKQIDREGRGVLHQLVTEAADELAHLEAAIRAADMARAVSLLCGASQVYALAQRRAFPIACYLGYALGQLDLATHVLDGSGGMLETSLRAIGPGDVLIAASFRNYSAPVIEAAALMHARGVPVIALTDNPLSPLKRSSTVCFELGDGPMAFRSLVAPMCLAQALVIMTGNKLGAAQPRRAAVRATATAARKRAKPVRKAQ